MAADPENPPVGLGEAEGEEIPEPVPVVHAEHEPEEGEESDEYDIEVCFLSVHFAFME